MKFLSKITSILFLFIAIQSFAIEIPERPSPPKLVNDLADILTANEEEILETKLRRYLDSTSTQIVVLTVKSLNNERAIDYATEVGHVWGVGTKEQDNGVVILIAPDDKKFAIATGYGSQARLTDGRTKRLENNYFKPYFKKGQYFVGLDLATTEMIQMLKGEFKADKHGKGLSTLAVFVVFIIIVVILFGIMALSAVANARRNHLAGTGSGTDWLSALLLANLFSGFFGSGRNGRYDDFRNGSGDFGGFDNFDFGGGDFGGGGSEGGW